ncbi:hypothetical protein, partial [uncultured Dubosiella sp.]|uniref:hypothetical protein n=1 Tax=uncultured Dubosiella sp. TaxID=1937011 RepID=UPI00272FFB2A
TKSSINLHEEKTERKLFLKKIKMFSIFWKCSFVLTFLRHHAITETKEEGFECLKENGFNIFAKW